MKTSLANEQELLKLIDNNPFQEVFEVLKTFMENVKGSDLDSLMLRNEFRLLHSEYFSYSINKTLENDDSTLSKKQSLKNKLKLFVTKLK